MSIRKIIKEEIDDFGWMDSDNKRLNPEEYIGKTFHLPGISSYCYVERIFNHGGFPTIEYFLGSRNPVRVKNNVTRGTMRLSTLEEKIDNGQWVMTTPINEDFDWIREVPTITNGKLYVIKFKYGRVDLKRRVIAKLGEMGYNDTVFKYHTDSDLRSTCYIYLEGYGEDHEEGTPLELSHDSCGGSPLSFGGSPEENDYYGEYIELTPRDVLVSNINEDFDWISDVKPEYIPKVGDRVRVKEGYRGGDSGGHYPYKGVYEIDESDYGGGGYDEEYVGSVVIISNITGLGEDDHGTPDDEIGVEATQDNKYVSKVSGRGAWIIWTDIGGLWSDVVEPVKDLNESEDFEWMKRVPNNVYDAVNPGDHIVVTNVTEYLIDALDYCGEEEYYISKGMGYVVDDVADLKRHEIDCGLTSDYYEWGKDGKQVMRSLKLVDNENGVTFWVNRDMVTIDWA